MEGTPCDHLVQPRRAGTTDAISVRHYRPTSNSLPRLPTPKGLGTLLAPQAHSLGGELADQLEGGEPGAGEVLFVAPHLDGAEPVADGREGGVMGQALVQEGVGWPEIMGGGRRERESRAAVSVGLRW